MGGQKNPKFSTKNDATGQKKDFFLIFFLLLHIFTSRWNFFVITKIAYLQLFREIMGDQKKRYINDNERTTTTNYIDDDNSPPEFFQNPRANTLKISKVKKSKIV